MGYHVNSNDGTRALTACSVSLPLVYGSPFHGGRGSVKTISSSGKGQFVVLSERYWLKMLVENESQLYGAMGL